MLEWIFQNGDRVTAFVLLALISAGAGLALHREWIFVGGSVKRMLADKDAEIERLHKRCAAAETRNEQLLDKLERTVSVVETVSTRRNDDGIGKERRR